VHDDEEVLGSVDLRAELRRRQRVLGIQNHVQRKVPLIGDLILNAVELFVPLS